MIVLGLLGCFVAAILILTLLILSRRFTLEIAYRRVAWLPLTALLVQAGGSSSSSTRS